jgi:TPR repeat protein
MALTVLTLRANEGEHRIACPLHASLTLGCGPECDVTFEGVGILPRHCVLYRTGERTFQIIGVYAAAQFSVNGVTSSELEVNAPFKFGIGGEVFDVDLAEEEDALLPETEPQSGAEAVTAGPRVSRRGYLLKPITLKPRAGERVGEVILATPPAPEAAVLAPVPEPVTPTPVSVPSPTEPVVEEKAADEEGASSLLLVGLLVCGVMVAGIVYWPHHLDRLFAAKSEVVKPTEAVAAPELSPEATVRACADLMKAGAPQLAAQMLMPLAEKGNVAAMHQLALALRASGKFGAEVVFLLQQAVEGGKRDALRDFVSVVDDPENPERYSESAFKQLQLAAKHGETSAWMPLGERYEYGNGTKPDIKLALAAFEKARLFGDKRATAKLSARQEALERVAAYVRSWNEVSVATLLDHVAAGQGNFYMLDHPPMEVLLKLEEEMRARWPLRRISVVAGAQAEVETFDLIKVTQPFQFEVQRGVRIARGKGVLVCAVQRDVANRWRITDASDKIEVSELLPAKEQFVSAESLRELKPAFTHAEQVDEARLEILEQMRGLEATEDFKPAITVVMNAMYEFPQDTFWQPFADTLCDRMARQLFINGKWLDAAWVEPVHQMAEHGSVSAMLLEGHLCAAGYGCPRNAVQSVALYQKAFEAGKRRDARFYYAEALFQGRGVPQDIEKAGALVLAFMSRSKHPLEAYLAAHLLWRKAEHDPALWQDVYDVLSRVANQFPPAKNLAGMVLLNHGQTTKERRTGFAAIKAAAEEGVVEAMKSLSQCYLEGVGCEKDLHLATLWKQKAMVTEPPRRRHYTEFVE